MTECNCSLSISVLGDGCAICQPDEYLKALQWQLEEEIEDYQNAENDSDSKYYLECVQMTNKAILEFKRGRGE